MCGMKHIWSPSDLAELEQICILLQIWLNRNKMWTNAKEWKHYIRWGDARRSWSHDHSSVCVCAHVRLCVSVCVCCRTLAMMLQSCGPSWVKDSRLLMAVLMAKTLSESSIWRIRICEKKKENKCTNVTNGGCNERTMTRRIQQKHFILQ